MRGLVVLMKAGFVIFGIAAAFLFIGSCGSKSSPNNTTDAGNLPAPTLVSPANGAAGQSNAITLTWDSVTGATAYDVRVSTVATFASTVSSQAGIISLSASVSGIANSTTYYWEVNATNADSTSAWSSSWHFTTIAAGTTVAGMVSIPGGTFQMGSNTTSLESWTVNDEEPVHSVTVSSFYMDSTDVTQASYQALMGVNPSYFTGNGRLPVESMTWYDAVLYCNARSKHDGYDTIYSYTSITGTPGNGCSNLGNLAMDFTQHGYRLPTEAEWEYACRAGSTADYYWGQSYPPLTSADTAEISAHAWWYYNTPNGTQPVATKPANAFGLYDMSGNVWQWCNDWWTPGYASGSQTDPTGPGTGSYRVLRGGSWNDHYAYGLGGLCAACRYGYVPDLGYSYLGFRCVRR